MLNELLTITFLVSLLSAAVRIATPIIFAALGELITERSGILNLGVEGMMLMGAFVSFVAAFRSGSLWFGVLAALLAGGALGLLMAFMSSSLKVDQTVTGLALNILASGLAFYGYRVAFKDFVNENLPTVQTFKVVEIPLLSKIPVLGETLFSQHALTYLALVMVPVIYFFLYRTRFGLELRCLGENPRAVDMRGVNIHLYQYLAVMFGGMMAGLGGAFLTLASAGLFVPDIAAGRGWIAIAIVIFGGWRPFPILGAALFFGLLDSFQLQIQGVGIHFPYQLLLALPYVLTIVALIVSRNRQGAPLSLGTPYTRE